MSKTKDHYPSELVRRFHDGIMQGKDGTFWIYGVVPLALIVDAKTRDRSLSGGDTLANLYEEITALTKINQLRKNRKNNLNNYRKTHLLLVNVPKPFDPPKDHPNRDYWLRNYGNRDVNDRLLIFGVQLKSAVNTEGKNFFQSAVEYVANSFDEGGVPLSEYELDAIKIKAVFERNGIRPPSDVQMRLANGYWNTDGKADVVTLPHGGHQHYFTDPEGIRLAQAAGFDDCDNWHKLNNGYFLPGESCLTFSVLETIDLQYASTAHPITNWVSNAMRDSYVSMDSNIRVISVRGRLEPSSLTSVELKEQRKKLHSDLEAAHKFGKLNKADRDSMIAQLQAVGDIYENRQGPATLTEVSIVIGEEGKILDEERPANSPLVTNVALHRQDDAWRETMMCSGVVCTPNLDDFPVQVIANSGIQNFSMVGDKRGALLGFTENDRQPAYVSATVASDIDSLPLMLVAGQTGSGKSMVMLHLADQFAREGRPQVIIDPKTDSHHDAAVTASGGQVYSLDSLSKMDGIFDPIRFSQGSEEDIQNGIEMASSLLLEVDPWQDGTGKKFSPQLDKILGYGVHKGGARCIGQALLYAHKHGVAPRELVEPVIIYAQSSAIFKSMCGLKNDSRSLRADSAITYIKVGKTSLDLPAVGQKATTLKQATAVALVRMMVFGSAMAMTGRGGGVVHLDEAWVFLGSNPAEISRLARLARSQGVFPILYTQKVTDALDADIQGAIGRALIMSIADERQAVLACKMFKIDPTRERIQRITANGIAGDHGTDPNWDSLRPLYNVDEDGTRHNIRGAIGTYVDITGRAVNVEITLAEEFLAISSTNPRDIERRREAERLRALETVG